MLCGNMPSAAAEWEHILRVDPDNVDALLYLAYYLQPTDPDRSAQLEARANRLLRK